MKTPFLLALVVLLGPPCCWPQDVGVPKKQIDIGAAQAPLNDAERAALDLAVKRHSYTAEKAVLDKAMAENPNSFELLALAGRLAYLERQPKDAAAALQRADNIKPLTEEDRMTLAIALEFSGEPERSRDELIKLTKLAPKNAEYLYLLGRMERQSQHLERAADAFAATAHLNPHFVRAYEDLGQVQEALGHPDEARKAYMTGAAVNRSLNVHWEWSPLDLGVVELKANRIGEAEKLFRESLQYNPRFAWGHFYMGQVLQKQGKRAEGIAEFKEAVVDDPRLRQAWLALAREFNRDGNHTEADKALAMFKKLEAQYNARRGSAN